MKTSYVNLSNGVQRVETVGRLKLRLKAGKVALIHKVQWLIYSRQFAAAREVVYLLLNRRQDRVARTYGQEASMWEEFENADYIARHSLASNQVTASGVMYSPQILEQDFKVPVEVASDISAIAVGIGTTSNFTGACVVFYEVVDARGSRLLKAGS